MALFDEGYLEFTLGNGFKVAMQKTQSPTIYARLRVRHGALHEGEGEQGVAHLLEHALLMGGTAKYNPEQCDQIRQTFGDYNARTSLAYTSFPVNILPEDLEVYLDFISDLAFHPLLDTTRVDEERQRALREIGDMKSAPEFKDEMEYELALLGSGPHTYFMGGIEDILRHVPVEKLREFHSRGYCANNMDLIMAGELPTDAEKLVRAYFEGKPAGSASQFVFPKIAPIQQKVIFHKPAPELLRAENPYESSAQLYMGLIAPPDTSDENIPIAAMVRILGIDTDSRLFKKVSQRKGLAYWIGSGYDGSDNKGIIQVKASVLASKYGDAIDAVFEEFRRLQTEPVEVQELDRTKKAARYDIKRMFETNEGYVCAMEVKLDFGLTPESEIARFSKVTPEMIMEAARKYLPADRNVDNYVLMIRDPFLKA